MDLSIYETLDGGDVVIKGNDLQLVNSLFNQPYLAMFGGNVEQSTPEEGEETLERFDWWGNDLLLPDQETRQFNSGLERALDQIAITSSGRAQLEAIVKEDLKYLQEVAEVSASVTLVGVDRIRIDILLKEPDGLQDRNFVFLWNGTKLEEITNLEVRPGTPQKTIGEGSLLIGEGNQGMKLI